MKAWLYPTAARGFRTSRLVSDLLRGNGVKVNGDYPNSWHEECEFPSPCGVGNGVKDTSLPVSQNSACVSVPLRGNGVKVSIGTFAGSLSYLMVSVPLRGNGVKEAGIYGGGGGAR